MPASPHIARNFHRSRDEVSRNIRARATTVRGGLPFDLNAMSNHDVDQPPGDVNNPLRRIP